LLISIMAVKKSFAVR